MKQKTAIDPRPGERLRQIREHREISQGKLARAIGVTVGTVQNYEHGRANITADRLEELARALQCEVVDLLQPPGSPLPRYRQRRAAMYRARWFAQGPSWIPMPRVVNEDE